MVEKKESRKSESKLASVLRSVKITEDGEV